jgi:hypothetical protein
MSDHRTLSRLHPGTTAQLASSSSAPRGKATRRAGFAAAAISVLLAGAASGGSAKPTLSGPSDPAGAGGSTTAATTSSGSTVASSSQALPLGDLIQQFGQMQSDCTGQAVGPPDPCGTDVQGFLASIAGEQGLVPPHSVLSNDLSGLFHSLVGIGDGPVPQQAISAWDQLQTDDDASSGRFLIPSGIGMRS